jgi:hypothetical protein
MPINGHGHVMAAVLQREYCRRATTNKKGFGRIAPQ